MARIAPSMHASSTTSAKESVGIPIGEYFSSLSNSKKHERHELYRKIYNRLGSYQFSNWNKHIISLSTCTNEEMQEYFEQLGTLIMAYQNESKSYAIKKGMSMFTREHIDEKEIMTVKYTTYHPEGSLFAGSEYIPISVIEYMKRNNVFLIEEKSINDIISREFDSASTVFSEPDFTSRPPRVEGERKYHSHRDFTHTPIATPSATATPATIRAHRAPAHTPAPVHTPAHVHTPAPVPAPAPAPAPVYTPTPVASPPVAPTQTVSVLVMDPYSGRPMLMTMPANGVVIGSPFGSPIVTQHIIGHSQIGLNTQFPFYQTRHYTDRQYSHRY